MSHVLPAGGRMCPNTGGAILKTASAGPPRRALPSWAARPHAPLPRPIAWPAARPEPCDGRHSRPGSRTEAQRPCPQISAAQNARRPCLKSAIATLLRETLRRARAASSTAPLGGGRKAFSWERRSPDRHLCLRQSGDWRSQEMSYGHTTNEPTSMGIVTLI